MPAYHPQRIEPKWQAYWERNKTFRTADLVPGKPKFYVLDMFPYPSGAGLHVGHPEGYTATDILCRYKRMRGFNVLHPMGWDAFGLPAEQYAIKTGTHPRDHDPEEHRHLPPPDQVARLLATTGTARSTRPTPPTSSGRSGSSCSSSTPGTTPTSTGPTPQGRDAQGQGPADRRAADPRGHAPTPTPTATRKRLAYHAEVPVNWCPALGTVLANEEVIDGKSERGGHPGRAACRCGSGCCASPPTPTACSTTWSGVDWPRADQGHAAQLDRPQRGRRGRFPDRRRRAAGSRRARSASPRRPTDDVIRVFTTRPDTLFGATYMVLAPEHPLVDRAHDARAAATAVAAYRSQAAPQERPRPHRPGQDEDRRLHRRLRDQPGQRPSRSRSGSPTTC